MARYVISIAWSDEDEGYVARVPEFPDLYAFGESQEEALAQAKDALEGYIESFQEHGYPLPQPMKRPTHSGQLRLRMPRTLHTRLAAMAENEGISLNQLIVSLISESLGYRRRASTLAETWVSVFFAGRAPAVPSTMIDLSEAMLPTALLQSPREYPARFAESFSEYLPVSQ